MTTRDTPTTYSADEAAGIRRVATEPDSHPECPRCSTRMELGPKISTARTITQEIVCPDCKRCVMLSHSGE